jgi:hypothetical protein
VIFRSVIAAGLLLALLLTPVHADPVTVTTTPVSSFQKLGSTTSFGKLEWRGGLTLESSDEKFGGFSGLSMSKGCEEIVAVSDAGRWFTAKLAYDGGNHLAGLTNGQLAPILDTKGKPPRNKVYGDAEALASLGNGKYLVGFESRPRVGLYDLGRHGLKVRFQLVKSPKSITEGPANGEIESIGLLTSGAYKGHYIAIAEKSRDAAGNTRGWLWKSWKTVLFTIERLENYDVTDLALLPHGDVLILERSFSRDSRPGMAIHRFDSADVKPDGVVAPALVFEGRMPFYAIDNMEGIAVCERDGETRVTLISDDNFNTSLQSTLLLQFALFE